MESWPEAVTFLRSCTQVPAALCNADLMDAAEAKWSGVVDVHTSMHDLRFVSPGAGFSALRSVRVSAEQDCVYSVELWLPAANNPRVAVLRSADKASRETAAAVLDAFLMQLVGGAG